MAILHQSNYYKYSKEQNMKIVIKYYELETVDEDLKCTTVSRWNTYISAKLHVDDYLHQLQVISVSIYEVLLLKDDAEEIYIERNTLYTQNKYQ